MSPNTLDPAFNSSIAPEKQRQVLLRKSLPLFKYMKVLKEEDTVNLMD